MFVLMNLYGLLPWIKMCWRSATGLKSTGDGPVYARMAKQTSRKEALKTFDFRGGGLKSLMTKHSKAVVNFPVEVLQLIAMLPLFTPALWPNVLD